MAMTANDMMRELHNYAMDEMFNRGLEEAESIIRRLSRNGGLVHAYDAISLVRRAQRDPDRHLSNWWGERPADISDCA